MNKKGFTLIELLIVIAIMAILAGVVFVALDPLTRFQDSRDSRRWGDVTGILSAIKIYQVDKKGAYLPTVAVISTGVPYMIGTGTDASGCAVASTTATVNLGDLVTEGYLASVPVDPSNGNAAKTLYYLTKNTNGTVTVGACNPEHTPTGISVAR